MNELASILPTLLEQTGIMLWIVAVSLIFGGLGGLVIGTGLYVTRRGGILQQPVVWWVLNVLVNTFRPIPFIIFLAAMQPIGRLVVGKGIGTEYAIFAIALAATFGIARIVEQNLVSIPTGVIEAARSTGASPWRIIRTVILPEALGPLVLGYTFAVIAIVDMSAVAGLVGGDGLGNYAITYGYRQFDPLVTWSALLVIVVVVQLIQVLGNWLARRIMRR
ncbi:MULTISPECIES: methionine ABC transporter permease [Agrococcus]|uniref:methionine ABC transporter permease n=1 Tax=Agrococcus TaxID=46352 RepID=UPI00047EF76A|nr:MULTISPECIES: methionine ABC transporter permease [Agrococcus]QUW19732.1 ABC transporter permease [Agrococcus sp. Marseille-Q4369]